MKEKELKQFLNDEINYLKKQVTWYTDYPYQFNQAMKAIENAKIAVNTITAYAACYSTFYKRALDIYFEYLDLIYEIEEEVKKIQKEKKKKER